MLQEQKTRETRLRRIAQRRGYTLVKSRRRDPRALGYGLYVLASDPFEGQDLLRLGSGKTLDEIEDLLD